MEMQDRFDSTHEAITHQVTPEFSTYHIYDKFVEQEEENSVNGWNSHIEKWLLGTFPFFLRPRGGFLPLGERLFG